MAQSSREIYWSAILADFRRSGLTHVTFCHCAASSSIHIASSALITGTEHGRVCWMCPPSNHRPKENRLKLAQVKVVTIIDLLPITIMDGSRSLQRAVVPVATSPLSRIVVPFPLVFRCRNGERTDDLAHTLVDHGTSFCVEPHRPCPRSLAKLEVSPPSS
jgi:hypothetical protein